MDKKYQVVTHSGVFHADEVMAVAILRQVLPEMKVVRTRDQEIISGSLIAIDVGGEYNEGSMRFDHHQREGAGERESSWIPYSSCGLIWKRFGGEICSKYFESIGDQRELFSMVDEGIISSIDLVDCKGLKALAISSDVPFFGVSQVISGYNGSGISEDASFSDAMVVATKVLQNELRRCGEVIRSKRRLEQDVMTSTAPILVMQEFVPGWAQNNMVKDSGFSRVVFQDVGGTWRLQIVPETTLLPEEWGGLSGEDLVEKCGVEDAIFCHRGRFIAGTSSYEGAMALAIASLPPVS